MPTSEHCRKAEMSYCLCLFYYYSGGVYCYFPIVEDCGSDGLGFSPFSSSSFGLQLHKAFTLMI